MVPDFLKSFVRGFIFMFICLMAYLIIVNFLLVFLGESLGLYENIILFIAIAIFLNVAPFLLLIILDRRKRKEQIAEQDEFLRTGTRTSAEVIGIQDTGVTINDNPVVKLTLSVNHATFGNFQQTINATVSRVKIPRIGDSLNVIYDPKNPSRMSVLYE